MMNEIISFKQYLTGIIAMDDNTFGLCEEYLNVKEIKKGEYLIRSGAICSSIAYINTGLFRIFYLKDGNEVNTCFCKENSITASFTSFVNRTPSNESIQAIENARIVTLHYDKLNKLYDLSLKWQAVGRLLTEKECLRLSNRASTLSFETAVEEYKNLLEFQPEIIQRVSIQHIASYIGVSRETLSRIRSKIAAE